MSAGSGAEKVRRGAAPAGTPDLVERAEAQRMVECRSCNGQGSHSRTRYMTSDPRATCDLETWDCGLCGGSGETTLAVARDYDTRRSM